jgi:hypothetical protein
VNRAAVGDLQQPRALFAVEIASQPYHPNSWRVRP